MSIMPAETSVNAPDGPHEEMNLAALLRVLEYTPAELHAPGQLPGETLSETAARRQAAADITDYILGSAA